MKPGSIRRRIRSRALLSLLLLVAPCRLWAQQAPDAGSLLRNFGPFGPRLTPPPIAPPSPPSEPAVPEKEGATVVVKDFRIRATVFPEATLKALLKDYRGRALTLGDLKEAALKIARYYRDHDLLARAILPRQTIQGGVVEIIVLEGKVGGITIDPASRTRLDPEVAQAIVGFRAPPGDLLHPSALLEGMTILNEVPGITATALLQPGAQAGETLADLKIEDTPLVTGSVQADDEGVHAVGTRRVIGSLAVNDLLGRGEQISAIALKSIGSTYGRLAVGLPVGASGLTLGVNGTLLSYHLGRPFVALHAHGYAYTAGATAILPIRRTEDFALTAFASFDHKRLVNQASGATVNDRAIEAGALGVAATLAETLLGTAIDTASATVTVGGLDRSANAADQAADRATARTGGTYAKLGLSLSRLQPLFSWSDLRLSASAQATGRNLDSAEQFSLGGPGGVRAYPVNEGVGDQGFLQSTELRTHLPERIDASVFYDIGGIALHRHPYRGGQTVIGQPNFYLLQGAGVSLGWTPVASVRVKTTFAHAIGPNPGRTAEGANSAGKHGKNMLWLEAGVSF